MGGGGEDFYEEYSVTDNDEICGTANMPPDIAQQGWYCSREYGHEGSCAAHPPPWMFPKYDPLSTEDDADTPYRPGGESVERFLNRVREIVTTKTRPRPGLLRRLWFRWVLRGWRSYDHEECGDRACRICQAKDELYHAD